MRHTTSRTGTTNRLLALRRSRGPHPPAQVRRHERRHAARHRRGAPAAATPDPVMLFAATWLACGLVLLGLTPLPLHDATLGWSPAFWALAAPAMVLVAYRACARWSACGGGR